MADRIARIELFVGTVLLAVIVALVFVASVMRFAGRPIIWSVDLAQLLFIWLCFVGATRAMRERAHLGVDLIVRNFGYRLRLSIELALAVLFIAFMAVLAVEGYKLTMLNRERLFGDSGISYAYVTIAVPVGCLFLTLAILANTAEVLIAKGAGRRLVFSRLDADDEPHREP